VFHARLTCSDGDCDETFEAWGTLEELEALACDCGCALEILTLGEAGGRETQLDLAPLR
jgi:hypothetical protein